MANIFEKLKISRKAILVSFLKTSLIVGCLTSASTGVALSLDEPILFQEIQGIDLVNSNLIKLNLTEKDTKGTVVVFLSARCPCSNAHREGLNLLKKEFDGRGFRFIGVHSNVNESIEETKQYFRSNIFNFPIIHDEKAKIADLLEAYKTPHAYIIDPTRKILYQGGIDDTATSRKPKHLFLKNALTRISEGLLPESREERVLGCEIKRGE